MKLSFIDKGREFDFGRTSEDYAEFRDIYPKSMYEKLIGFGIGKAGQRILDLGSGTAVLPVNMYQTGADFVASDISENQIRYAERHIKERGIQNIKCKVCKAEETGFADNSFDAVTAVQCFSYFDADKAVREIHRILKPNGYFCKIFMDWLPKKDPVIAEMEDLVLRYNPDWCGGGFEKFRYTYPAWADGCFEIETIHSYDVTLTFTKEAWIGRIRSCRGVGASLSPQKVREFEQEYRKLLDKYTEPLQLKHRIHMEIYRAEK